MHVRIYKASWILYRKGVIQLTRHIDIDILAWAHAMFSFINSSLCEAIHLGKINSHHKLFDITLPGFQNLKTFKSLQQYNIHLLDACIHMSHASLVQLYRNTKNKTENADSRPHNIQRSLYE